MDYSGVSASCSKHNTLMQSAWLLRNDLEIASTRAIHHTSQPKLPHIYLFNGQSFTVHHRLCSLMGSLITREATDNLAYMLPWILASTSYFQATRKPSTRKI